MLFRTCSPMKITYLEYTHGHAFSPPLSLSVSLSSFCFYFLLLIHIFSVSLSIHIYLSFCLTISAQIHFTQANQLREMRAKRSDFNFECQHTNTHNDDSDDGDDDEVLNILDGTFHLILIQCFVYDDFFWKFVQFPGLMRIRGLPFTAKLL